MTEVSMEMSLFALAAASALVFGFWQLKRVNKARKTAKDESGAKSRR